MKARVPCTYKLDGWALGGVGQWIECRPANLKLTGWIPGQGTCLDCRPGPHLGACGRPTVDVSFPLFLLPYPSP